MNHLSKILNDSWALRRDDFENVAMLLLPAITKGDLVGIESFFQKKKLDTFALSVPVVDARWELDSPDLPEGSVAVVNLSGMLYSWMTAELVATLRRIEDNPKVCGVVLQIDGPGGMVARIDQGVSAIRNLSKPVATVVTGMMASAHFWLGTSADKVFIASPLCEVGSVGVVVSHYSFREYYKKIGIDYREIYPDSADLKNKEVRALENEGDETPVKERAAFLHRAFAEDVAKNLGIAYDAELPLFRGEMFFAPEAIEAGYVSGYGDLQEAATWVFATATSREANTI